MKKHLFELVGTLPNESGLKKRMRFHQGWLLNWSMRGSAKKQSAALLIT